MQRSINRTIRECVVGLAGFVAPLAIAQPTVVTFEEFETSLSIPYWAIGAQNGGSVAISTDTTKNFNGSDGSLKGTYPASDSNGGVFVWGTYDISDLATRDVYIEFWAKMPAAKEGLKFLKIFGVNASGNFANTTFGLDYNGFDNGGMYQVSFGDGSTVDNDTQKVIYLDGSNPTDIGRSYGTATVLTPQSQAWEASNWGTDWHHFRFHVKFNSGTSVGTEVADGEYFVEIDDVVYVDATGLLNRHYSNAPIERIELFGQTQGNSAFEVWYDNVKITTDGFEPGC